VRVLAELAELPVVLAVLTVLALVVLKVTEVTDTLVKSARANCGRCLLDGTAVGLRPKIF
jgi:hypothetical protein